VSPAPTAGLACTRAGCSRRRSRSGVSRAKPAGLAS
jgi:hypothetical protein